MKTIGIVKSAEKGLLNKIIKKTEFYYKNDIEYVVVPSNCDADKRFKKHGVDAVILTCPYSGKIHAHIVTGEDFYLNCIPLAIKKIIKIKNLKSCVVAVMDKDLSVATVELVKNLLDFLQYIVLITENTADGEILANEIMEDYGVSIVVANTKEILGCNIAVNMCGENYELPKNAVILEKFNEHNIKNGKCVINNFKISLNSPLPFYINTLALAESYAYIGAFCEEYNITEFLFYEKAVNLFDIS